MNHTAQYLDVFATLLKEAQYYNQRRMIVVSGTQSWAQELLQVFCKTQSFDCPLWVTDNTSLNGTIIDNSQAKQFLGREVDLLIYDAYCGFDPNAMAAILGTLRGGGLFVLITPPLAQWTKRIDPEYKKLLVYPFELHQLTQRFISLIKESLFSDETCIFIEQDSPLTNLLDKKSIAAFDRDNEDVQDTLSKHLQGINRELIKERLAVVCRTQDQLKAVEAIIKVSTGHRRRPVVITSDRGRGKSSALGIASACLLQARCMSIAITAPKRSSVDAVFEQVKLLLDVTVSSVNKLQYQQSSVIFVAPDEVLKCELDIDLLLVDEAAAIPTPMLSQMLQDYSRIAFSTTVHGYEGTGRGFAIRFKHYLDTLTPQWRSLSLSEPIRWSLGDPVERWLFGALLLDAEIDTCNELTTSNINLQQCVSERVNRDDLLNNNSTLKQLFAILINAHYQTSPSDLRNLLDGPNVSVWLTRCRGRVVAAGLVMHEGKFDKAMSQAIWDGKRRPQGHLLPQTLVAHSGWQQAAELSYWRVMRIAVIPEFVRCGLGKQLLNVIAAQAQAEHIDMIGASFASTADVMTFWKRANYVCVRIGVQKDGCSGVPSSIFLQALNVESGSLLTSMRNRFIEQFCYSLGSVYQDLSSDVVVQLLTNDASNEMAENNLTMQDWLDINAFANTNRQLEACLLPLYKLSCICLRSKNVVSQLTIEQQELIVRVLMQHQKIPFVIHSLKLQGKKHLTRTLRNVIKKIIELLV